MHANDGTLSVSRLVSLLRDLVEENFIQVVVTGEIANFSAPSSGHLYFALKDDLAQLRGVMFRTANRLLNFMPENGVQVVCWGRVSLYPQRGELQLVVERMEALGVGSWQLAFEKLKRRLGAEGLFDAARKRRLPPFPRTIGVVTSPTGAAIHDILNVLRRRGAGLRVLLCPVRVQGDGSAQEVARGIADLNRNGQADVIIVGRGGGSPEDLWAFNEEIVARAVFESAIPVISAVGHEVDVTIADLVADLRAPTPSAAAELVVQGRQDLERHVDHLILRLSGQMQGRLQLLAERVAGLRRRLRSPVEDVRKQRTALDQSRLRLQRGMQGALQRCTHRLGVAASRLHDLSPLATLDRGYAIVFADRTGQVVRSSTALKKGDRVSIRLAEGEVAAIVEKTDHEPRLPPPARR
ncbi:exodeoxyribonuclease VII large subunit [Syntrophotalea acetylenica]|uniref:Exodeoxyribonuclease 7 large subunit n=1 Tax=Syntrophotalea acetylenica TaxID=29542 RepID=A0A1L3GIL9_SYNAC|nr:exodeoxyribonuclease VII large subunit [Syntrophotalea acetylenica]APG25787.1 exodeoxyribonuclease VII large subunit [Syntrophotalea acetylenica]APG43860.1 exodeoxyribonuclease VII large subunit [Syntrophotalea acetylenica]